MKKGWKISFIGKLFFFLSTISIVSTKNTSQEIIFDTKVFFMPVSKFLSKIMSPNCSVPLLLRLRIWQKQSFGGVLEKEYFFYRSPLVATSDQKRI